MKEKYFDGWNIFKISFQTWFHAKIENILKFFKNIYFSIEQRF